MRPYLFRLFILHLLLAGFVTRAQTVGNEWINYNQTYYKIKTGKEGIYRVAVSALTGLPSTVNGSNLVLYRDGQEMPLYVSANGPLGTGDYIEFHGRRADGRLDKELYENPAWHPDDRISLFSDTAVYFLTYDNQSNHQRFVQTPNTIPATPPPPPATASHSNIPSPAMVSCPLLWNSCTLY